MARKLSATAIVQYERCPRQYKLERIDKIRPKDNHPALFGRVIHRTIERLLAEHKSSGSTGILDAGRAADILTEEWGKEPGLAGHEAFSEGLQIMSDLCERLSPLDPESVLSTEEWFSVETDGVNLVGVIDLVLQREAVNEETGEVFIKIEVLDWKTTREFLTTRDAAESIQLAIYDMAMRLTYDADQYETCFYMLRSSDKIRIRHTNADLESWRRYIVATAEQIDREEEWKPKLNPQCVHCHVRKNCEAFLEAVKGELPPYTEDMEDIRALAVEREGLSIRKKIVKKRLEVIDNAIKALLSMTGEAVDLGEDDWFFKLSSVEKKSFAPSDVLDILAVRLGLEPRDVLDAVAVVQKGKLDKLFAEVSEKQGVGPVQLARGALENRAERTYSSRLYSKKQKAKGKKK